MSEAITSEVTKKVKRLNIELSKLDEDFGPNAKALFLIRDILEDLIGFQIATELDGQTTLIESQPGFDDYEISFNFNSPAVIDIGTIAAGKSVSKVTFYFSEGFDGTGLISVGDGVDPNRFMTDDEILWDRSESSSITSPSIEVDEPTNLKLYFGLTGSTKGSAILTLVIN